MTTLQDSYRNFTIDHSLISQKDELLHQINKSNLSLTAGHNDQAFAEFKAILFTLRIVKDFWVSQSYGYKFNELVERIREIASARISILEREPHNYPKQTRRMKQLISICDQIKVPAELNIL